MLEKIVSQIGYTLNASRDAPHHWHRWHNAHNTQTHTDIKYSFHRTQCRVRICLFGAYAHRIICAHKKKTNQRTVTGPNRSRAQCTIPMKRSLVHSSSRLLSNTLCCITLYWFAFMYRIKSNKVAAHDDDMLPCSRGDDSLSNIFFFIFGATLYSLIHKS